MNERDGLLAKDGEIPVEEEKLFQQWYDEYERDPEYITHGLLYRAVEAICEKMEAEGMTRRELAGRLNVSPQYVTKFLNTPTNTSVLQLVRFAAALGLTVDLRVGGRCEAALESPSALEDRGAWRPSASRKPADELAFAAGQRESNQGGLIQYAASVRAA